MSENPSRAVLTLTNTDITEEKKSLTLSEILLEEVQLLSLIVEKEGEILPEIEDALKASQFDLETKTDNYARVIERLELEAQFRAEKARYEKSIQARCEAVIDRMKDCMKFAMLQHGKKELRGKETRFMLTGSKPKVELREGVELEDLPGSLLRMSVSLDKEAVHRELKNHSEGVGILKIEDFFTITPSYSLRKAANVKSRKELQENDT